MTLEEMRARLEELGIPHDQWQVSPGGVLSSEDLESYKTMLNQVRDLLQVQIGQSKAQQEEATVALQRIKHGGA